MRDMANRPGVCQDKTSPQNDNLTIPWPPVRNYFYFALHKALSMAYFKESKSTMLCWVNVSTLLSITYFHDFNFRINYKMILWA